MNNIYDVIISGAGPVGLFLACELGLAGTTVLVLERDVNIDTPYTEEPLGLRGVNTLSAEAFYRRGLMEQVFGLDSDRPASFTKTPMFQFAGHFAGIMLDANKFDLSRWKYRLPGPSLSPGRTNLGRLIKVLSERAESLGVTILRGSTVTSLSQKDNEVTVNAGDQVYRAKYLVGCDGGRSTVRKEAGFEFVGTDAEFTGYTGICELDDASKLKANFHVTPMGMYFTRPLGHVAMMDFDGAKFDRTQTVTREHFENVLRRVSGTDVSVEALHFASTFTDRARQATTYRKNRVLLAGDSAHIHSPLGAQGLNAGLGDAMNLGWKLAATVKETAPEGLLDTYTEERHPVGAWVLEWTRAQVAILKPNPFAAASFKIMKELIDTTDGTNYFIDKVWGLTQRYDLGDEHQLVGASVPDFEFASGLRLGTLMNSGKGLLIDFTNDSLLAELSSAWKPQVSYVNEKPKDSLGLNVLLVRPDGIVAWLTEGEPDLDKLKSAFNRWFYTADHANKNHSQVECRVGQKNVSFFK